MTFTFQGKLDLGDTVLNSRGGTDLLLVKYDSTGKMLWIKQIGGPYDDYAGEIVVRQDGSVALTGTYSYDVKADNLSLTNNEGTNAFICVFNPDGQLTGIQQPQLLAGTVISQSIGTDLAGDIYLSGGLNGKVAFGPDTLTTESLTNVFVARLGVCNVPPVINGPASANLCGSESLELSVPPLYDKYQWFRSGEAITGATGNKITAREAGIYRLVVDSGDCRGVSNAVVIVRDAKPSLGLDITLCEGDSAMLQAGTYSEYLWSDSSTGASLSVRQLGTYWIRVKDKYGCYQYDSIKISQSPNPAFSINTSRSPAICPGDVVQLSGPSGYSDYAWYRNGTAIINAYSSKTSATDTGLYTLHVINNNGCTREASIHVHYLQLDTPEITASGPLTICEGDAVVLSAVSGYARYQWRRNDTAIANATARLYTVTQSGSYTLQADSLGCSVISRPMNVDVNPRPVVVLGKDTVLCRNDEVLLDVGKAYSHVLWSTGDSGRSIRVDTSGTYWVKVQNGFGCEASDTINVGIRSIAKPQIELHTDTLVSSPGPHYQWYYEGQPIQGADSSIYFPKFNGHYQVEVRDAFGCSALSDVLDVSIVKITVDPDKGGIWIYPNPVSDKLTIEFNMGPNTEISASLQLYDMLGRLIASSTESLNSNVSNKLYMNTFGLAEGMYLLHVKINGFSTTEKIVKVRQ